MKIRKSILILLLLSFTFCQNDHEKINTEISRTLSIYVKGSLDKGIKLDDLKVTRIDTLTMKKKIRISTGLYSDRIDAEIAGLHDMQEQIRTYTNLYELSGRTDNISKQEATALLDKSYALQDQCENLMHRRDSIANLEGLADSVTFLHYLVFFTLKTSDNRLVQKTTEGAVIITQDYKVIETSTFGPNTN